MSALASAVSSYGHAAADVVACTSDMANNRKTARLERVFCMVVPVSIMINGGTGSTIIYNPVD
jgi:hypothetical protein